MHEPTRPLTHLPTMCYTAVQQYVQQHISSVGTHRAIVTTPNRAIPIDTEFIPLSSCWDYHFLTILRHPEERAMRRQENASPRPQLAKSVIGARSVAGDT